jgi:hypothetical protein
MNTHLLLAVDLPEQMLDGYLKHLLLHLQFFYACITHLPSACVVAFSACHIVALQNGRFS